MGNKDKGKRETKKAPKPQPKAEPVRRQDDITQAGPRTIQHAGQQASERT